MPGDRAPLVALLAVLGLALGLRCWHLSMPNQLYFDETFYVKSAVSLLTAQPDPNPTQPAIGKMLIAGTMRVCYTFERITGTYTVARECLAWRWGSVAAGMTTILVVYLLGASMFGRWTGVLAAFMLSVDFLHIVMSRVAMLDIYLTMFATCGVYATWEYTRGGTERRWWLWLGIITLSLAVSTKWNALFTVLGCLSCVYLLGDAELARAERAAHTAGVALRGFAVMAAVYFATHYSRMRGAHLKPGMAAFMAVLYGVWMVMYRYAFMVPHRYMSAWWQWPTDIRPVWMFFQQTAVPPALDLPSVAPVGGVDFHPLLPADVGWASGIVALGSPWVWWTFLLMWAAGWIRWYRRRGEFQDTSRQAELFLLVIYTLQVGLWVLARGFFYYMLLAMPCMALLVARCLAGWWEHRRRRWLVVAYLLIALGMLIYFWPVLVAQPLPMRSFWHRMWLPTWV